MQSKSAMQVGTRMALHYFYKEISFYQRPKRRLAQWLRNGYNTPVA